MKKATFAVLSIFVFVLAAGCQSANNKAGEGALIGGVIGAAAGGIIGHQSGSGGEGAAIGAVTGALAGSLIGSNMPKNQTSTTQTAPAQ